MTALVGQSGAGKSTILNLIPRFYNIDKGDIKIDNQSIYKSSLFSLRKGISLVSKIRLYLMILLKITLPIRNLMLLMRKLKRLPSILLLQSSLKSFQTNMKL